MRSAKYGAQRAITAAALAVPLVLGATGTAAAEPAETTGRLLVTLESRDQAAKRIGRVADAAGVEVATGVPEGALFTVEPEPGETGAELRRTLLADPRVESVRSENAYELRYQPNDPAYGISDPNAPGDDTYLWHLRRQNFEPAWNLTRGGGAEVAIIDTGVSATHPDLQQVIGAADHDPTAPTGATSDENGHGTHVSGLACGDSDNGYGIASAGFDCRIVAEKLDVNGNNLGEASIVAAIYDAAGRGVDVINMSLGGAGASPALSAAIDYAFAREVVIVTAAANANSTNQEYPARYVQPTGTAPDINVGKGLVVTMARYDGSNAGAGHGTGVSLAAYGDSSNTTPGIFSSYPANMTTREPGVCLTPPCAPRTSFGGDTKFGYLFGTSMATPQVAGLAALIRSLHPGLAASAVIRAIKLSASGKGTWIDPLGWGIIDAAAALEMANAAAASAKDSAAPSSKLSSPRRSRRRSFRVKVESTDPPADGVAAAGIEKVNVWSARNGGRFTLVYTGAEPSFRFKGKRGARYRFLSQAFDKAGNIEQLRSAPDSVTRVRRKSR